MFKHSIVQSKGLSIFLRVLLYVFLAALIVTIFYFHHVGGWRDTAEFYRYFLSPQRLRAFIASFGPFGAVVFVLIQALQVVFAPIPGEVTGFVGGFLYGNTWGSILSTIGLTLGSVAAFQIARVFGLRLVEKVVKKAYIEKFNEFVTHKGLYISYILFLIPGFPKDSLCYLLGLTHMRFLDFFLMALLGRLPGTIMLTFQGTAVKDARYTAFIVLFVVSVALTLILYFARNHIVAFFSHVMHRLVKKKKQGHRKKEPVVRKNVKRVPAKVPHKKSKAHKTEDEGGQGP
jgi:uncharacterized membrane protein YdjX (TVP38/TMEM64 family)